MHFLFFFLSFCITIDKGTSQKDAKERKFNMISNQILQTTVDGLKAISRVDFCVIDADGKVAAKTFDDVAKLYCRCDCIYGFSGRKPGSEWISVFQGY